MQHILYRFTLQCTTLPPSMSIRPPSDGDTDKEFTAATRGNDFNSNTLIKYCQRRPNEPEKLSSASSSYRTPILSQQRNRDARAEAQPSVHRPRSPFCLPTHIQQDTQRKKKGKEWRPLATATSTNAGLLLSTNGGLTVVCFQEECFPIWAWMCQKLCLMENLQIGS